MSYRFVNTSGGPVTLPIIDVDVPDGGVNDIGDELVAVTDPSDIATLDTYVAANGYILRDAWEVALPGLASTIAGQSVPADKEYYVKFDGSDTEGDGLSWATAWATVTHATNEFFEHWIGGTAQINVDDTLGAIVEPDVEVTAGYAFGGPRGLISPSFAASDFTGPLKVIGIEKILDTQTSTSSTDTSFTKTSWGLVAGAQRGNRVRMVGGDYDGEEFTIEANTTDTVTIIGGAFPWAPFSATEDFEILGMNEIHFTGPETAQSGLHVLDGLLILENILLTYDANLAGVARLSATEKGELLLLKSMVDFSGLPEFGFAIMSASLGGSITLQQSALKFEPAASDVFLIAQAFEGDFAAFGSVIFTDQVGMEIFRSAGNFSMSGLRSYGFGLSGNDGITTINFPFPGQNLIKDAGIRFSGLCVIAMAGTKIQNAPGHGLDLSAGCAGSVFANEINDSGGHGIKFSEGCNVQEGENTGTGNAFHGISFDRWSNYSPSGEYLSDGNAASSGSGSPAPGTQGFVVDDVKTDYTLNEFQGDYLVDAKGIVWEIDAHPLGDTLYMVENGTPATGAFIIFSALVVSDITGTDGDIDFNGATKTHAELSVKGEQNSGSCYTRRRDL